MNQREDTFGNIVEKRENACNQNLLHQNVFMSLEDVKY